MSLFNLLSTQYSPIEKQLLKTYSQTYLSLGHSKGQSEKIAKELLDNCIKESKNEGTYSLPSNMGDIFLEKEKSNPKTKERLTLKRQEGVTNGDIRWWWNINDIERRMMLAVDDVTILAVFTQLRESGANKEEAAEKVKKGHPIFGEPDDSSGKREEDSPIPYELKDRVNIYIESRAADNVEVFKKDVEQSSSFNALIRKEIKAGNI